VTARDPARRGTAGRRLAHATVLGALGALGACNTPTPTLQFRFAGPPSQSCPSTECSQIPMTCKTVMSIRIVDPADTSAPYLSECIDVPAGKQDMCSLATVDLTAKPLPVRDLEVQVALYPASVIPSDPDAPDGRRCPANVQYSAATGFPVEQSPTPALGGQAFYHPGDDTVTVTLGCTDLASINESCVTANPLDVTASVDDFDTLYPVPGGSNGPASQLRVSVGEPRMLDGAYVLSGNDSRTLKPVSGGGALAPAIWADDIDLRFDKYVCVEVYETIGQSTGALRCKQVTAGSRLELRGARISKETLQKLLGALEPQAPPPFEFPDKGLTIGVVADQATNPVSGITVTPSVGTLRYQSSQGMLVGGVTSSTGIFVSTDAPFGTTFSTSGGGRPSISAIGGMVGGRVTIVVLQFGGPPL